MSSCKLSPFASCRLIASCRSIASCPVLQVVPYCKWSSIASCSGPTYIGEKTALVSCVQRAAESMSSVLGGASGSGSQPQHTAVRRATHAGSWYSDSQRELSRQLDTWLGDPAIPDFGVARAIIAPHAGYAYCGETAAYAYKQINPDRIERVFILGPSHHVCLSGCALSMCSKYKTPLYDLNIDQNVNAELLATGAFDTMDHKTDENEHSIEMHLPFIAKVFQRRCASTFTIVPILVGSLSPSKQASYGRLLARYIADPHNLFVISSDFCHWGSRFHFTPFDRSTGKQIFEHIEALDKEGMNMIESLNPPAFCDYLKRTQNTICGRHPICVMLQAAEHFRQMNNHRADFRFLHYSQSNRVRSANDSSVSYAAGALLITPR